MSGADEKLQVVLEGYSNFLREKKLTLPKHQPHLVRWVREFLLFAGEHSDYTFEQTLDLFLTALSQRAGSKPWQIQQASDAIRIYRYQYLGYRSRREVEQKGVGTSGNNESLIERLREIIRLCHYARSMEKTYLHWTRRFLAYRMHAGLAGEPTAADVKAFLTRLAIVEKVSASTSRLPISMFVRTKYPEYSYHSAAGCYKKFILLTPPRSEAVRRGRPCASA